MSKPREIWWGYAKAMIRQYPELHREYRDLHTQQITARMDGSGGGSGVSRPVERLALRQLPGVKQQEHDAVERAIEHTQRLPSSRERLSLISLMYWGACHNLEDAADRVHISLAAARKYHRQFVHLVGKCYGLE